MDTAAVAELRSIIQQLRAIANLETLKL